MIDLILNYIELIVVEYGALGVFVAILIEQIISPIPSILISMLAGFFLLPSDGSLSTLLWSSIFLVAIPVAIGSSIGSLFIYSLGYLGGKPAIEKCQKWIGLDWGMVERAKQKLDGRSSDEIVLFFLWIIPVFPSVAIAVLCGIIRYPLSKYIVIAFAGMFMQAIIMSFFGWHLGELYKINVQWLMSIEDYVLYSIIILALGAIGFSIYKKNIIEK